MDLSPWYLVAAWPFVGVLAAVVMARRGHDLLSWAVLGVALGPLTIPLAVDHARHEASALRRLVSRSGDHREQPRRHLSALVGLDGSANADAALRAALSGLGASLRHVTLARVLDYETADPQGSGASRRQRHAVVQALRTAESEIVRAHPGVRVEAEVLVGSPADALIDEAERGGHDIVVVGARGHSASKAILGSTAAQLVSHCPVPVFVAGDVARRPVSSTAERAAV